MNPLEPPDKHYLLAAQGWLELGNPAEAFHELSKISPAVRMHPDVVKMRWQLYGKADNWRTVLEIARAICRLEPTRLPVSVDQVGRTVSAVASERLARSTIQGRLPELFAIPYNLACYACQLGNVTEAWEWFQMAIEMSDAAEIRRLALNDPDLSPIWEKIKEV